MVQFYTPKLLPTRTSELRESEVPAWISTILQTVEFHCWRSPSVRHISGSNEHVPEQSTVVKVAVMYNESLLHRHMPI